MFKKSLVILAAIALAGGLVSCAAKYADLNDVMSKMIASTEALVTGMDKATDAKGVADAVVAYTNSLKDQQGKFKEVMDKYPELKDAKEPPKELKENVDKLNGMTEKLMNAMAKLQTYAEDPAVKDAVQKMTELQLN